jgi:hypothetical protein
MAPGSKELGAFFMVPGGESTTLLPKCSAFKKDVN